MEPNNGIKPWQWIVTIIIIIIIVVLGIIVFRGKGTPEETAENTPTTQDNGLATGQINRVVLADVQFPGNVVYISSVQLSTPGWVVIHKDDAGKPGAIIGYSYFDKGINPGKVTLTENTVDGGLYYAELHSDNGDKVFDPSKDLPMKDASGAIIMKPFHASQTVTEFKG